MSREKKEGGSVNRTSQFSPCRRYRYTLWREWDNDMDMLARGSGCCHGGSDGECAWKDCPQIRDKEPTSTGRHCILDQGGGYLMVIGLNPSTADETKDDPTLRRCIAFAKRWGFEALCMTNLYAWRETKPAKMLKAADPIGPDNEKWLRECAAGAGMILAAWGTNGKFEGRGFHVLREMANLYCLRLNDDGTPEHPLYVPNETVPMRYTEELVYNHLLKRIEESDNQTRALAQEAYKKGDWQTVHDMDFLQKQNVKMRASLRKPGELSGIGVPRSQGGCHE